MKCYVIRERSEKIIRQPLQYFVCALQLNFGHQTLRILTNYCVFVSIETKPVQLVALEVDFRYLEPVGVGQIR